MSRKAPYRKWIENKEAKERLKDDLEKAGMPLQSRVRRVLEKEGFRCLNYHYFQPINEKEELPMIYREGKYRELDIYAFKTHVYSFDVYTSEISFSLTFLVEYKYSSDLDFFAFETKERYFPAFPVMFNGERLMKFPYLNFKFPMVIEKISEVNVKKRRGFGDEKTHEACEQLTAAFSHLYEGKLEAKAIDYGNVYQRIFKSEWEAFIKESGLNEENLSNQVVGDFITKNYSAKQIFNNVHLDIELGFPIMVIDENMGLIKVVYDTDGSIKDFEDVGYGIYPYVSENANKYNNILGRYFALPIIICNQNFLTKCLKTIDEGMHKTVEDVKALITNNPYAFGQEILISKTKRRVRGVI